MIRFLIDLKVYNTMMSRDVNFRPSDLSSVFNNVDPNKYLKRLFRKYRATGDVKVRLIINHIVVLQNVFGADVAVTLLLFKIDKEYWSALKTILNYLKFLYSHELGDVDEDDKIKQLLKEL